MYSYEDRIRAVRLFIKLGKRTGPTIRQLGYPTRNALRGWHREFERAHDLPAGFVRSKQRYSEEQKQVAVEHYLSHDRCLAGTRKALGYPCRKTLGIWIEELHPQTRIRVVGNTGGVQRSPELKQAAVIELCTRNKSARAVAQGLGVSRPTLYNWKDRLLGREVPAFMKLPHDSPPAPDRTELERQVEALRRAVHVKIVVASFMQLSLFYPSLTRPC